MRHPVLTSLVRSRVRQEARRRGHSLLESIQLAALVDDDLIDVAQMELPQAYEFLSEVRDGGGLLDRLLAFLDSDLGKALIKFILSLLGI